MPLDAREGGHLLAGTKGMVGRGVYDQSTLSWMPRCLPAARHVARTLGVGHVAEASGTRGSLLGTRGRRDAFRTRTRCPRGRRARSGHVAPCQYAEPKARRSSPCPTASSPPRACVCVWVCPCVRLCVCKSDCVWKRVSEWVLSDSAPSAAETARECERECGQ